MTAPQAEAEPSSQDLVDGTDKLFGVRRVAQMLNVEPGTVSLWLRKGRINGLKVATLWKVKATEVVRVIDEGLLPEDPNRNYPDKQEKE